MTVYYLNSYNEKIILTEWPYMAHANDLMNFAWSYDKAETIYGNKVHDFKRNVQTKYLQIDISADNREKYYEALDKLHTVVEKDVLKGVQGKLYLGSQYLLCNAFAAEIDDWDFERDTLTEKIKIVVPNPAWTEEVTTVFTSTIQTYRNDENYPHDYPFDYQTPLTKRELINSNYESSNFELRIFGPCNNPVIYIGDNTYQVNWCVGEQEYISVNSVHGTVTLKRRNGVEENIFHYRGENIFKKISAGKNLVSWNEDIPVFEIVLFHERSFPKWTGL